MATRARVEVFIAASLDGYIARPDGDISWLTDRAGSGEDYGYGEFISDVDTIVMGRLTYEKVLTFGAWPYGDRKVVVLGRTQAQVAPELSETVRHTVSTPPELVAGLSASGSRRIYVDGGRTIQGFLAAGLIDEMTITTIPILLGSGIPLFGRLAHSVELEHARTRAFPNGFVQSTYVVRHAAAA